ncbi:MAG TPA: hypothetical protein VGX68_29210 [Thermoanaerobaculia bacterium]|nr:hypothetical protein [Thermoanaerobaculia bacterium]
MKRRLAATLAVFAFLAITGVADARRVRVVHRGPRTVVHVHTGFPLRRPLPHVYVRAPRVAVRVTPRVFLPSVVFGAVVVPVLPAADVRVWREAEVVDREEGWTEFTMNVDRRGSRLLLEINRGPAQISFAEVVFENGEAQVVDFNDRPHGPGVYSLLDFKDGRKVDHVRIVAQATRAATEISLHLLT